MAVPSERPVAVANQDERPPAGTKRGDAGLLGIEDELEREPPAQPPAEEDESRPKLPTTVEESLELLEADERMVELLGSEFGEEYLELY